MQLTRIYQNTLLQVGTELELDERSHHYLVRVLRVKKDDPLILFNGKGGEYQARIVEASKKKIRVEVQTFNEVDLESPLSLHLGQSIAKGEKMDFILQKAVELGVHEITPLNTIRSNVKIPASREAKRLEHWNGIIVSACEQCGRNKLPVLHPPTTLKKWLVEVKDWTGFVLSPFGAPEVLPTGLPNQKAAILIGPEGGFDADEIKLAKANHFSILNLGPRILRTETAGLAAMSILQAAFGDMAEK